MVVDNASTDGTAEMIRAEFPAVHLVEMPHSRYGACETFNVGFAQAETPWIAILDDQHDKLVSGLTEEQLPGTNQDHKYLYQRLALPWPFSDRQWVIDLSNNRTLWEKSHGAIWERTWSLADRSRARSGRCPTGSHQLCQRPFRRC